MNDFTQRRLCGVYIYGLSSHREGDNHRVSIVEGMWHPINCSTTWDELLTTGAAMLIAECCLHRIRTASKTSERGCLVLSICSCWTVHVLFQRCLNYIKICYVLYRKCLTKSYSLSFDRFVTNSVKIVRNKNEKINTVKPFMFACPLFCELNKTAKLRALILILYQLWLALLMCRNRAAWIRQNKRHQNNYACIIANF